jgi:hypothetical protein
VERKQDVPLNGRVAQRTVFKIPAGHFTPDLQTRAKARGQKYVSAGVPRTELSVRQYSPKPGPPPTRVSTRPAFSHGRWIAGIVLAVLLVIAGALPK